MEKFKNKVVLVTGGTSGIGLATAKDFMEQGATVIITGRFQETIDQTIKSLGPNAFGFVSDAGNMQDVLELQQKVKQFAQAIDVLFVNAGYGKLAPIEAVTEDNFDELFNLLVKGSFFTVQQLLPLMNEGGSIILNTSIVTGYGAQNFSVYAAAKAAVQSFVKNFAAECTARKIRVNGISPGYIKTDIFNKTGLTREQIQGAVDGITPAIPFQRFGQPSEIAGAVRFLASEEASYIHAAELVVDGGYLNIK